jgi:integrase/recombinase XerD
LASIKLSLDTRRAILNDEYPLIISVSHKGKSLIISTGIYLQEKSFDIHKCVVIGNKVLNEKAQKILSYYANRMQDYVLKRAGDFTVKELRDYLVQKEEKAHTIRTFWEDEITRLKSCNRLGGADVYQMSLHLLEKVLNLDQPFHMLNTKTLYSIEEKLALRGIKVNSIGVYMRTLKAICNKAIKHELVTYAWYPFRGFTIRKERTTPRVLSLSEIQAYFQLQLSSDHPLYHAWCIGKLLFLLRGINIRDLMLLSPQNIKAGRIIYKRAKTGKLYSVKQTPEIHHLFEELKDAHTLVSWLCPADINNTSRKISILRQRAKVLNHHLNKLGKLIGTEEDLSTYVFRYTYANIAKQLGYSKDLIAEALGHEYGNKVTGIYLEQFDQEVIDMMNLQIIEKVTGYSTALSHAV